MLTGEVIFWQRKYLKGSGAEPAGVVGGGARTSCSHRVSGQAAAQAPLQLPPPMREKCSYTFLTLST